MRQKIYPMRMRIFAHYLKTALGFWSGRMGWLAWLLCLLLIVLIILQLYVQYRINFWNRDFFNALSAKNFARVVNEAWLFLPLALSSILLAVLTVWSKMTAQRTWRKWLSQHMIAQWVENEHYLQFTGLEKESRNAEYRIAEDARVATDLPFELSLGLIASLLTAGTFIGVLWEVGGSIQFQILGISFTIPGYLVWGALGYSTLFTCSTIWFARRLTWAVEQKNAYEAEYRAAASGLRQKLEENHSLQKKQEATLSVENSLNDVIYSWKILCYQLMRTTFVSNGNAVLAPVMGLLLCAPKYLGNGMSIGEVVQAQAAFVTVQHSFNWLLNNYPSIADWISSSNRVGILLISLDKLKHKD